MTAVLTRPLAIRPVSVVLILAILILFGSGCAGRSQVVDQPTLDRLAQDIQANRTKLLRFRKDSTDITAWNETIGRQLPNQPVSVIRMAVDQGLPVGAICIPHGKAAEQGYTWRVDAGISLLAFDLRDPGAEMFRRQCLERLLLDRPYAYKSLLVRLMRNIRANEVLLLRLREMLPQKQAWDAALGRELPAQALSVIQLAVHLDLPAESVCRPELRTGEESWQMQARSVLESFRLTDLDRERFRTACLRAIPANQAARLTGDGQ